MKLQELTGTIIECAMKVHSELGAGLLESVYEICLAHELRKRGLKVDAQVTVPVFYDGIKLDAGFRIDLLVEDTVVVEIKAVESLLEVHKAQTITYLKLSGKPVALLINFNVAHLKDGIRRFEARKPAAAAAV
jgi:GxxExxY protein